MDYGSKKVAVTGAHGFIGGQLVLALTKAGANVYINEEIDIRNPEAFANIDYTFDYLFHFGAPSSQVLFKRNPYHCAEVTLKGFMNAADACRKNGVKLIYPSTGLLSQGRMNDYAMCKKVCEMMAADIDSIGIRIFATYGPNEGHKRDYASVPYLFARDAVEGRESIIFGDGEQTRDFIYIDDVVDGILNIAERCNDKVIDLGSGESHSFNEILDIIEKTTEVRRKMIDKPVGYVSETLADTSAMGALGIIPKIDFKTGIELMMKGFNNEG